MRSHLALLKGDIQNYFPDVDNSSFITPFVVNPCDLPVGTGLQEELISMQEDDGAKFLKDVKLDDFWLQVSQSLPALSKKAIQKLLVFPSAWECGQGFSTFFAIKSKTRSRLKDPGSDFRCAVSVVQPRINALVDNEHHPSH